MTKAKIIFTALYRVAAIPPLIVIVFVLQVISAMKYDIIPSIIESTKMEWSEITFNVRKIFNRN
jgi:type II secretory pathway component PulF